MKKSTRSLVLCAMCTALTCVLAPVSIPVGQVPISLATFAVMLSAALLDPKWGVLSQVVYLLLGCIGLPVFAGFSSGVASVAGPTGGYLLGYLALAAVEGVLYRMLSHSGQKLLKKSGALVLSMAVGTAVLYAFGTVWFCAVTHTPIGAALMVCVVPFLLGDVAKIAVVTALEPQLERVRDRLDRSVQAV